MLEMQQALLREHPEWGPHDEQQGLRQLLWLVGELGEVVDIVKKRKPESYLAEGEVRRHLVEEFTDVLMYFIDTLDCYGITPAELSAAYIEKNTYNMTRDYKNT